MRQRISIRGCVRPSIGPSVHSAFSQMTARRILCQVSALFFKTAKTLVCQFIEIFCFLSKKRIFRMTLNHFWDHLKWWTDNVCLEKNWLGILESNKLSRGKKGLQYQRQKDIFEQISMKFCHCQNYWNMTLNSHINQNNQDLKIIFMQK